MFCSLYRLIVYSFIFLLNKNAAPEIFLISELCHGDSRPHEIAFAVLNSFHALFEHLNIIDTSIIGRLLVFWCLISSEPMTLLIRLALKQLAPCPLRVVKLFVALITWGKGRCLCLVKLLHSSILTLPG